MSSYKKKTKSPKSWSRQISKMMKKEKAEKSLFFLPSFLKRAASPLAIPLIRNPIPLSFLSLSNSFLQRNSKEKEKRKKLGASRRNSESSLKSQPFYRRYKPILPTSLNYIVLNRPEAIHLGDLMRFLVRIDPNRSVTIKRWKFKECSKNNSSLEWITYPPSPKQTKRIIAIQKRMVSEVAEIKW